MYTGNKCFESVNLFRLFISFSNFYPNNKRKTKGRNEICQVLADITVDPVVPAVMAAVSEAVRAEVPAEAPAASVEEDHPWEGPGPIWAAASAPAVGDTDPHPLGAVAAAAAVYSR